MYPYKRVQLELSYRYNYRDNVCGGVNKNGSHGVGTREWNCLGGVEGLGV